MPYSDPPRWFSQREQWEIGLFLLVGGLLVLLLIGIVVGIGVGFYFLWNFIF